MKRFCDNYPDITPPNVISGGFRFDHPMDDEWDYYLASVFGDVEALARIRAANPKINGTMHYEFPLIMAVRNGRTDAVRFLLAAEDANIDGGTPTNDNVWYSRCIDAAKERGFDEIHAMLLETRERAEADAKSQLPHPIDETLETLLNEGDVAAVKRLLAEKSKLTAAPADEQTQYLHWAYNTEAKEKQVELVRVLIDHGVDPNSGKLIFQASQVNNVPLVKLLLEKGADPNTEVDSCGNCMLVARDLEDGQEMLELLASYGGRALASFDDERPTVDQLFAFDDERKQTLYASGEFLWMVLQSDDGVVLDRFVEQFGNEQIKVMSIQKHWFHVPSGTFLNRLVEYGLNVNQRDWRGRSFIFSAGDEEWLQRYIELDADLNVIEFMECSTRLGYAAFHNNLGMASFLLENGADPNLPNEHEWARPLTWAKKQEHTEMVTLLQTAVD